MGRITVSLSGRDYVMFAVNRAGMTYARVRSYPKDAWVPVGTMEGRSLSTFRKYAHRSNLVIDGQAGPWVYRELSPPSGDVRPEYCFPMDIPDWLIKRLGWDRKQQQQQSQPQPQPQPEPEPEPEAEPVKRDSDDYDLNEKQSDLSETPEEQKEKDSRKQAIAKQYAQKKGNPETESEDEENKERKKKPISMEQATKTLSDADAKPLLKALLRLFKSMDASTVSDDIVGLIESPRIDGGRLVAELVSRRLDLSRVGRVELSSNPKQIVISADVSPSCKSCSGATVGICQALTRLMPRLTFVKHANGYIETVTTNGQEIDKESDFHTPVEHREMWLAMAKKSVGCVLFSDDDGFDIFSPIWRVANCQTVWLDHWGSKGGTVKRRDFHNVYNRRERRVHVKDKEVRYFSGVFNHHSAACAIRQALRF